MIEDKELRNLFKIESQERLQHLDDGLLRLEQTPADQGLLEELFREAHSLKGAARMLGLTDIQTMAHQLEDAFGAARKGEAALKSEAVVGMNQTLAAIRGLVLAAIGEGAQPAAAVEPAAPPQGVAPIAPAETPLPEIIPPTPPVSTPPVGSQPAPAAPAGSPAPRSEAFHIETIRVDPKRLDALLSQAGELTVTKIRLAHRVAEIDGLLDECEEWSRGVHSRQFAADAAGAIVQRLEHLQETLNHLRSGAYEDSTRLDYVSGQLESGIRALRLLPMSTLFMLFPRLVHDLAQELHKEVALVIDGEDTVTDKHVLEEIKDPLMHMLRNAIDHGIEPPEQRERAGKSRTGSVWIKASQTHDRVIIEVGDDGRGLDIEAIKSTAVKRGMYREAELAGMTVAQIQSLILVSGFSTTSFITDLSGRGVGLDVVRNNVERLKGTLQIESAPNKGLIIRAQLPVSLATVRVLVAMANGRRFALPAEYVQFSRKVLLREIYTMEGHRTFSFDEQPVSVAWLGELLELPESGHELQALTANPEATAVCVVLGIGEERFGLMVDDVLDELEVMLKPQSRLLKRIRNVSGATILETGEVCVVLNPHDLFRTLCKKPLVGGVAPAAVQVAPAAKKVLLLAEDSITTRTQEKRILESAGYEIVTAVDGMDAYNKLGLRDYAAVVSDINMPNMTGLELAEKIRANKKFAELPIILVTSLSSEADKRRGLEAGANAYISKPEFDQRALLDCLKRLI
ncbi:MAG TPA: hybrid sensor histidine kinase/response regulator [Gallionella sp.]|nr:hybrid sensor histidine kinase/response regulator [Gallionella sp.]